MADSEPEEPTPYDYVLVDSRTGITEVGGLCVGPLADRLIVLTGLNDQNVVGTRQFLDEVGIHSTARTAGAEPWDEADPGAGESPSLGPKPTLVVASPVPASEVEFRKRRLTEIEKVIGLRPLTLPYHPLLALMETNFVREYPEEQLTLQYRRLTDRLMEQVGDGEKQLFERGIAAMGSAPGESLRLALRLAWSRQGSVLASMVDGLLPLELPTTVEAPQLFRVYSVFAESDPAMLNNWGSVLGEQAKAKSGSEAERLLADAVEKYAEARRLKPDDSMVLYNWGNALFEQAKAKGGSEAERLLADAVEKYAEAHRLKPHDSSVLNNWSNALREQAKARGGVEAEHLWADAVEKYVEAHRLKPDDSRVLNNWGDTLFEQAKAKGGAEAERLRADAVEKYAEAHRLKPDDSRVLNNWGGGLIEQAKVKARAEAERLWADARAKLEEAERIKPGSAAYNLACLESLTGHPEQAVRQLRREADLTLLTRTCLTEETDFDPIREHPAFQTFLASLPE